MALLRGARFPAGLIGTVPILVANEGSKPAQLEVGGPVSVVSTGNFYVNRGTFLAPEWHQLNEAAALATDTTPAEGFYRPQWTGSGWTEGKSEGEILEAAKETKKRELGQAALSVLALSLTPGLEVYEAIFLLATATTTGQKDGRLDAMRGAGEKLLAKHAQTDLATTEAELEAISWEEQT